MGGGGRWKTYLSVDCSVINCPKLSPVFVSGGLGASDRIRRFLLRLNVSQDDTVTEAELRHPPKPEVAYHPIPTRREPFKYGWRTLPHFESCAGCIRIICQVLQSTTFAAADNVFEDANNNSIIIVVFFPLSFFSIAGNLTDKGEHIALYAVKKHRFKKKLIYIYFLIYKHNNYCVPRTTHTRTQAHTYTQTDIIMFLTWKKCASHHFLADAKSALQRKHYLQLLQEKEV